MISQVASQIISFGPYGEKSKVVLACSGGADSTFLAHAYKGASQTSSLPTAIVAVIDHAQHEQSSEQTAQIVNDYRKLGFEVVSQRIPCDSGISENDMRNQRYGALLDIARRHQASKIFVAHHADDQAETIDCYTDSHSFLFWLKGVCRTSVCWHSSDTDFSVFLPE